MTSPELTGEAGCTFEDVVAACYLVTMVGGTTATGVASRGDKPVAQQHADFGEPLEDVIIEAVSAAERRQFQQRCQHRHGEGVVRRRRRV